MEGSVFVLLVFLVGVLLGGFFASFYYVRKLGGERAKRVQLEAKLAQMEDARNQMQDTFVSLAQKALEGNSRQFLEMAKESLEALIAKAKAEFSLSEKSIEGMVGPVKELMARLDQKISQIEKEREGAFRSLQSQIRELSERSERLRVETERLYRALRQPKVRGRWGEMTLRNAVELAGLAKYCDFDEQVTVKSEEGINRPDMVIRLPGGRFIAVDAKVPVDHFLDALEAEDEQARVEALKKHARALREHMKRLSSKSYWKALGESVDFVVMFIPADSLLGVALEMERNIIEEGIRNGVVVATPTLFVALLRVVALSWKEFEMTQQVKQIAELGRELYKRASTLVEALDKLGKDLSAAVKSYNKVVGSWESRFAPQLRKFESLSVSGELKELRSLEGNVREVKNNG